MSIKFAHTLIYNTHSIQFSIHCLPSPASLLSPHPFYVQPLPYLHSSLSSHSMPIVSHMPSKKCSLVYSNNNPTNEEPPDDYQMHLAPSSYLFLEIVLDSSNNRRSLSENLLLHLGIHDAQLT